MSNVFGIIFGVIISLIICLAIVFALYIAYHFGYEESKRPAPPKYQECDPEALPNVSTDSRYPPPHHITLHIPPSDGNIPVDTVQLDKQTLMTEYYHPVRYALEAPLVDVFEDTDISNIADPYCNSLANHQSILSILTASTLPLWCRQIRTREPK